jgi:5-methylcytosine-specific restriction endonuclease McrA
VGRGDLNTQRWKRLRKTILERDRHECQIRGPLCQGVATAVDHIVAHALGGGDEPGNLRAACKPCNSSLAHTARRGGGFSGRPRHPSPPYAASLPSGPAQAPTRGVWHVELPA